MVVRSASLGLSRVGDCPPANSASHAPAQAGSGKQRNSRTRQRRCRRKVNSYPRPEKGQPDDRSQIRTQAATGSGTHSIPPDTPEWRERRSQVEDMAKAALIVAASPL